MNTGMYGRKRSFAPSSSKTEFLKAKHLKLLLSDEEQISVETNFPEELTAPIEPGTIVGSVRYYLDGEIVQIYPVTATDQVTPITLPWCLKRAAKKYFL